MRDVTLTAIGGFGLTAADDDRCMGDLDDVVRNGDVRLCGLDAVHDDPARLAARLALIPFDAVHVTPGDGDGAALGDTLDALARHGIAAIGHLPPGRGVAHATLTRANTTIGLLGFSESEYAWCWRARGRGDAFDRRILDDVRAARARSDVVVVSLRWGLTGATRPAPRQIRLGRLLIDAGAHVVVGRGRVVQGLEVHRGGLIAYSLGALGAAPIGTLADESVALEARVGAGRVGAWTLTPARIRRDGPPARLEGDEDTALRERVAGQSSALETGGVAEASWLRTVAWAHLRGQRLPRPDAFTRRCVRALLDGTGKARGGPESKGQCIVEEVTVARYEQGGMLGHASPFVTPGWLEAFRHPGRSPIYLRVLEGGEVVGALAGLRLHPRRFPLRGVPTLQTFLFFSGPAVPNGDRQAAARCVDALCRFADARGVHAVLLGSWDHTLAWSCEHEGFEATRRREYVLRLAGDRDALLARMSKDRRKKMRAARRTDLTCGHGHDAGLLAALRALSVNTRSRRVGRGCADYEDHYLPQTSDAVVARHLEHGIARVAYAEQKGEKHAAMLVVSHGSRAHSVITGISKEGYRCGAGDLLHLHVMETLRDEGVETLDLGGIPEGGGAGLRYYKSSLGAVPRPCTGGYLLTPRARVRLGLERAVRRLGRGRDDGD